MSRDSCEWRLINFKLFAQPVQINGKRQFISATNARISSMSNLFERTHYVVLLKIMIFC